MKCFQHPPDFKGSGFSTPAATAELQSPGWCCASTSSSPWRGSQLLEPADRSAGPTCGRVLQTEWGSLGCEQDACPQPSGLCCTEPRQVSPRGTRGVILPACKFFRALEEFGVEFQVVGGFSDFGAGGGQKITQITSSISCKWVMFPWKTAALTAFKYTLGEHRMYHLVRDNGTSRALQPGVLQPAPAPASGPARALRGRAGSWQGAAEAS